MKAEFQLSRLSPDCAVAHTTARQCGDIVHTQPCLLIQTGWRPTCGRHRHVSVTKQLETNKGLWILSAWVKQLTRPAPFGPCAAFTLRPTRQTAGSRIFLRLLQIIVLALECHLPMNTSPRVLSLFSKNSIPRYQVTVPTTSHQTAWGRLSPPSRKFPRAGTVILASLYPQGSVVIRLFHCLFGD